jgi:hypothetical protein
MAESTGEKNLDQPKLDQSKPDGSKSDQSNLNQSGEEKSNLDRSGPNKSGPNNSDQDKSSRDQSDLDHAKIDKLVAVNRELAIYFEEQLDAVLALRQSVVAIERALLGSAAMKKKYEKCLQSVKDEGAGLPDMQPTIRIRGVLSRLQRSGTL